VEGFTNVRESIGSDFEIAVHCHWEFDFFDALRSARGMEKIRPWWLENVVPPHYVDTVWGETLHPRRLPSRS
jgi:L-alanine-DL-glutamate epimerase-like enolase superfamily enzyme